MVFVEDIKKELLEGREILPTIKELTPVKRKYEDRIVNAIVSSSPDKLSGIDVLRVRSLTGVLYPRLWAIKIVEEVCEVVPGIPNGKT